MLIRGKTSVGEWQKYVCSIFLCLAFTACTGKSDGPKAHLVAEKVEAPVPNPETLTAKFLDDKAVLALQDGLKENKTDLSASILEPLRKSFFKKDVLLNSQLDGTQRDELLRIYNLALLRFNAQNPEKAQSYLEEYEKYVFLGCDSNDLTGCRLVKLFQKTASSFDVWTLIVERKSKNFVHRRAKSRMAWKLVNEREDQRANIYYLERAEQLEKEVAESKDKDFYNEHWTTIERILQNADKLSGSPVYDKFIRRVLDGKISFQSGNRVDRVRENIIVAEAKNGILRAPWFQEVLAKNYSRSPKGYEVSSADINTVAPNAKANLGVKEIQDKDFSFYLIENVYLGVWTAASANQLWIQSKPTAEDAEKMHAKLQQYIQLQMLSLVTYSNLQMAKFFKDRTSYNSNQIHTEAYRFSQELQGKWLDLYNAMAQLRGFASLLYGAGSPQLQDLHLDQDSLNDASLYMVSFPHMLILAYQMAVQKFTIQNWFSEVDYTLVIDYLLKGKLGGSFFDYTTGGNSGMKSFSPTQLLVAFYFALQTDSFSIFEIKPEAFLSRISKEFILAGTRNQNYRLGFRELSNLWSDPQQIYRGELNALKKYCEIEKKVDAIPLETRLAKAKELRSYSLQVQMENLTDSIFPKSDVGQILYDSSYQTRLTKNEMNSTLRHGLNLFTNEHEQALELARLMKIERFYYIEDMLEIYRQYLKKIGTSEPMESAEFKELVSTVNVAKHDVRRFYSYVYKYVEEFFLPCFNFINRKEFDLQNAVIRYEYEWLKQLYRDHQKLVELGKDVRAEPILAKYKLQAPGTGEFKGFDHFDMDRNQYVGYRLDALFRFAKYFKSGLVTDTVNLLPINSSLDVIYSPAKLKKMDAYVKPMGQQMSFEGVTSETEFANKYIKLMRSEADYFDNKTFALFHVQADYWLKNQQIDQLSLLANLYKTGAVEVYSDGQADCLAEEYKPGCKVEQKSISDEVLREQLYSVLDILAGTKADHEIYDLLAIRQRGKRYYYRSETEAVSVTNWGYAFLFQTQTMNPQGFFDFYHLLLTNLKLGYEKVVPWNQSEGGTPGGKGALNASVVERARQFYEVKLNEAVFLFPVDKSVDDYLFQATNQRLKIEFDGPKSIQRLAERSRAEDEAKGFVREYFIENAKGPSVKSYYLDPVIVGNQQTAEFDFHKETGNLFK